MLTEQDGTIFGQKSIGYAHHELLAVEVGLVLLDGVVRRIDGEFLARMAAIESNLLGIVDQSKKEGIERKS